MKVEEFYNNISKEYTSLLDKAIPKYQEMLSTVMHYVPDNLEPKKILELGCGTGNLTQHLVDKYPNAKITVVDISKDILKECSLRFSSNKNIEYLQADFNELNLHKNKYNLIFSSIAIHHLKDEEKESFFNILYTWLNNNGVFIYADQCKGETEEIYKKHIAKWKTEAFKLGSTEKDWNIWMEHQNQHDFHSTINMQIDWLRQANFKNIDIVWRNLLWSVFYAEK